MKRLTIFSVLMLAACGQPFTSDVFGPAGDGGDAAGTGGEDAGTVSQGSGGQGGQGGQGSSGGAGGNSSSGSSSGSSSSGTGGTGGDCGNCQLDNALAVCVNGQCAIQSCTLGYDDCDGSPGNGCEIHSALDPEHCGNCVTKCSVDNADASCAGGDCQISQCAAGFHDCNNTYSDGCETSTANDTENCGGCNLMCGGASTCLSGECICGGAMTSVNPDVTQCLECLGGSCCDKLLACQNDALCNQELKNWESCVKNNGQQNCCFGCGFADQKWLDLRSCEQQNACSGHCGN